MNPLNSTVGADVAAALTLSALSGVGSIGYARLIARFGSAEQVLCAGKKRLMEEGEVRAPLATRIALATPNEMTHRIVAWAKRTGVRILPLEDRDYPEQLTRIADPPPVLYVKGDGLARVERSVGVVGSRWISAYGKQVTRQFCDTFAQAGMTVVSGMALGVDGHAHRAALDAGGNTVAVLGTGLDRPYPPEHARLFDEIAQNCAVVSEFPPGTKPLGANFPRRNRVISGLSMGVVVVEAKLDSGSLITARLAADQGREVYAVPGNVGQPGSAGTNRLIREGAALVTCGEEVVADLLPQLINRAASATAGQTEVDDRVSGLPEFEQRILKELSTVPVSIDMLAGRLEVEAPPLLGSLLEMEFVGLVEKLPGNRYIRPPGLN